MKTEMPKAEAPIAAVRERPILFAPHLVKAILSGPKRATRRPVEGVIPWATEWYHDRTSGMWMPDGPCPTGKGSAAGHWRPSPYGRAGDSLYVRENFALLRAVYDSHESLGPDGFEGWVGPLPKAMPTGWGLIFEADDTAYESAKERGFPWRPSIHMPRWASRLTLRITSVAVERLGDISDAEIPAEGAESREAFFASWDAFYGKDYPAKDDPWTWVYTFEVEAQSR